MDDSKDEDGEEEEDKEEDDDKEEEGGHETRLAESEKGNNRRTAKRLWLLYTPTPTDCNCCCWSEAEAAAVVPFPGAEEGALTNTRSPVLRSRRLERFLSKWGAYRSGVVWSALKADDKLRYTTGRDERAAAELAKEKALGGETRAARKGRALLKRMFAPRLPAASLSRLNLTQTRRPGWHPRARWRWRPAAWTSVGAWNTERTGKIFFVFIPVLSPSSRLLSQQNTFSHN